MSDVQQIVAGTPTIVVVDDESSVRNGLSSFLEDEGYVVYCAENGKVALHLVKSVSPALVITDFMMPEMSGKELAMAMRADASLSAIPLVLITGAYLPAGGEHEQLFAKIVAKPFHVATLLHEISALLGR